MLCRVQTSKPTYQSIFASGLLERSFSPTGLLLRLRLLLLLLLLLRAPRPPRRSLTRAGLTLSFGGGLTNAKSTDMVWSRNFAPFSALIDAFASPCVGYSIRTYP